MPIAFRNITDTIGYGWANRVCGFTLLVFLLISLAVLKPRTLPSSRRSLFDWKAITEPSYVLFSFGLFAVWTGMYLPYFYIPLYARNVLKTSADISSYMLAFLGAGSVLGRILTNMLAERFGVILLFLPVILILGCLPLIWIAIKTVAGTIVFCVFYGFVSGASVSLTPVMLAAITLDIRVVGTRMGMAFTLASFGLLIGSPIGGILLETHAKYTALQVFSSTTIMAGFSLYICSVFFVRKRVS